MPNLLPLLQRNLELNKLQAEAHGQAVEAKSQAEFEKSLRKMNDKSYKLCFLFMNSYRFLLVFIPFLLEFLWFHVNIGLF